jgi:hypothetical protein
VRLNSEYTNILVLHCIVYIYFICSKIAVNMELSLVSVPDIIFACLLHGKYPPTFYHTRTRTRIRLKIT